MYNISELRISFMILLSKIYKNILFENKIQKFFIIFII